MRTIQWLLCNKWLDTFTAFVRLFPQGQGGGSLHRTVYNRRLLKTNKVLDVTLENNTCIRIVREMDTQREAYSYADNHEVLC